MKICWYLAFLSAILLDLAFAKDCNQIDTGTYGDWGNGRNAYIRIPAGQSKRKWRLAVTYDKPVNSINPWQGKNGACGGDTCTFGNEWWNGNDDEVYLEYTLDYPQGNNPNIKSMTIEYCSDDSCSGGWQSHVVCGDGSSTGPAPTTAAPTTAAPTTAAPTTEAPNDNETPTEEPNDTDDGTSAEDNGQCTKQTNNYKDVIHKSLLFYEAQRSGVLPADNRVPWRADSCLSDGSDVGVDLTGGYNDAGDFVKFGFPAANALTVLAWGGISYKEGYEGAGELDNLLEAIKWGTDWLIKCHVSDNEFYAQVGNGVEDHKTWIRPEENDNQNMWRPSYKINCQNPGSDMAAEAASTFASASMLFKGKDNAYSAKLLDHAERIYAFAEKCKGKYSDSISDAAIFYNSWSGYGDELAWGAAWLYKATGDASYLTKAKQYYTQYSLGGKTDVFSWDNKAVGVQALLAELDGGSTYKDSLKTFCDKAVSGQTRSPGGELHYFQWGSLRYSSNAAFICLQAADLVPGKETAYTNLAEGQMDYILGDNPLGMSFVVGYGTKYPKNPHHSASACPDPPQSCGWGDFSGRATNTHLLVGALVGGPGAPDDQYTDKRDDYIEAEVTLDYNAGFQGVLAGLQMKKCNA